MLSIEFSILLIFIGLAAGIINTLAGGGSNLTLPVLMMLGLPADVANGTNRVGVFLQCVSGIWGFWRKGSMPVNVAPSVLMPTLIGGLLGALMASFLSLPLLKPALLLAMLGMALLILLKPSVVAPPKGTPIHVASMGSLPWWGLFLAGIYGGFVQAGVGFVLLGALCGLMRFDLVRANALKVMCAGAFTLVALIVFIARDQVAWIPGILLAAGSMIGAQIGVHFAHQFSASILKWFLFIMTLCACSVALLS